MPRQHVEPEIGLHAFKCALGAFFRVGLLKILEIVDFALTGVAHRHIKQFCLVAPLRNNECDTIKLRIGQFRHNHLVADSAEPGVDFINCIRQQFWHSLLHTTFILKGDTAHHRPAAHMHVVDIHVAVVVINPEHIHIVDGLADNDALGPVALHQPVFLLQHLGLLKPQVCRQALHLRAEIGHQLTGLTTQNLADMLDIYRIIFRRYATGATTEAAFKMVFQA